MSCRWLPYAAFQMFEALLAETELFSRYAADYWTEAEHGEFVAITPIAVLPLRK